MPLGALERRAQKPQLQEAVDLQLKQAKLDEKREKLTKDLVKN